MFSLLGRDNELKIEAYNKDKGLKGEIIARLKKFSEALKQKQAELLATAEDNTV